MAFFSDNFTDSDGTLLDAHTPDTGTSWTRLWGTTGTNAEINTNRCRSDGDLNSGVMYTADVTYPSADYDVTFTLVSLVNNAGRPAFIFVRIQDQENMYAVYLSKATTACSLYKKVSGTWSTLGSAFDEPADGSVCKLEIIGTALKFYDDGVEVASATDSAHSTAGKAGIGFGGGAELVTGTDDGSTSNIIDTLSVNNLGGGTTFTQTVAGTLTSSGALVKKDKKVLAGVLTSVGTLTKKTSVPLAGVLSFSGSLTKKCKKVLSGTLTSSGSLVKSTHKILSGILSSSGGLATRLIFVKILTGTLSFSGTLVKKPKKVLVGTLLSSGGLTRKTYKLLTGSLSFVGNVTKKTRRGLAGVLSFVGSVLGVITAPSTVIAIQLETTIDDYQFRTEVISYQFETEV